jgi:hypothetical protein
MEGAHEHADYRGKSDEELEQMAFERAAETGDDPSRVLGGMKGMRTRQEKEDKSTAEVAKDSFVGKNDQDNEKKEYGIA